MNRRAALGLLAGGLTAFFVPSRLARLGLGDWEDDDEDGALGRGVGEWLDASLDTADFHTGHEHFDREWLFGTWMMAAMGFGHDALVHPARTAANAVRMDQCIAAMLSPAGRSFDTGRWKEDPLASKEGHAAWLGYLGTALALRRQLGASEHDALHAKIADMLADRMADGTMIETFRGERYPVDNAACIATIGRHPVADRWVARVGDHRNSDGLLHQYVGGPGRGSGTFLAAWFLGPAYPELARSLYEAGRTALYRDLAGFGAMQEFADGWGRGDIDSGPIVAGLGLSATGFAIGAARGVGDDETFRTLAATTSAFGGPVERGGAAHFATGGPLGDAILYAMFSTPRWS